MGATRSARCRCSSRPPPCWRPSPRGRAGAKVRAVVEDAVKKHGVYDVLACLAECCAGQKDSFFHVVQGDGNETEVSVFFAHAVALLACYLAICMDEGRAPGDLAKRALRSSRPSGRDRGGRHAARGALHGSGPAPAGAVERLARVAAGDGISSGKRPVPRKAFRRLLSPAPLPSAGGVLGANAVRDQVEQRGATVVVQGRIRRIRDSREARRRRTRRHARVPAVVRGKRRDRRAREVRAVAGPHGRRMARKRARRDDPRSGRSGGRNSRHAALRGYRGAR